MPVVYKLTRSDGLEYVGITVDLNRRIKDHMKSDRFSIHHITDIVILYEGVYEDCAAQEPEFIKMYNTFNAGLNCTVNGKGRVECDEFNTLGFVFSAESRKKMSDSAKKRGVTRTNFKHSDVTKRAWSEKRRGVFNGTYVIDPVKTVAAYNDFIVTIDLIKKYCKKTMRSSVNDCSPEKYLGANGKPLSKRIIFCREYSVAQNVTKEGISACLHKHGI